MSRVISDCGTRRAAARWSTARLAPRFAPLADRAAFLAAMISWRVAPFAPNERTMARTPSAAAADFLLIIVLPVYVQWAGSACASRFGLHTLSLSMSRV